MMHFTPTPIAGLIQITAHQSVDARGGFARLWCNDAFMQAGIAFTPTQTSLSTNPKRHTLRGMHMQATPHSEAKLVQCVHGAIYDVAVDLRSDSPTFKHWFGLELSAEQGNGLFIPAGCAHGFLSLTDHANVLYHIDAHYVPEAATGVRWNDPAFGITWPAAPQVMSERDANWGDFGLSS